MRCLPIQLLILLIYVLSVPVYAKTLGEPCERGSSDCMPYGCISVGDYPDPDLIPPDAAFVCGKCKSDSDCPGGPCDTSTGECQPVTPSSTPKAYFPKFHLAVADLSFSNSDDLISNPTTSVGYIFQHALSQVKPVQREDGSWVDPDLPDNYVHIGGLLSLTDERQMAFVELGWAVYHPCKWLSCGIIEAVYQIRGKSILDVNDSSVTDRLGPALNFGILQNVYVKAGYLYALDKEDDDSVYLSVSYMADLFKSLLPNR